MTILEETIELSFRPRESATLHIAPGLGNCIQMAKEYGDIVLPINRLQPDKIHPSWAGYKEIANATK